MGAIVVDAKGFAEIAVAAVDADDVRVIFLIVRFNVFNGHE